MTYALTGYFANLEKRIQCLITISECFKEGHLFREAEKMLRKALEYAWLIKSEYYQLLVYDKLGIVYYVSCDVQKADYYHERFTKSQLEDENSPAYIIGVRNANNQWMEMRKSRVSGFSKYVLDMSYLLRPSVNKTRQEDVMNMDRLVADLRLDSKEDFQSAVGIFLAGAQFSDKIESIDPILIKNKYIGSSTPEAKLIMQKMETFDHLEKIKNHDKLRPEKSKKQVQIPRGQNIYRAIEERLKAKPVELQKLYLRIKKNAAENRKEHAKVNLPVLISHIKSARN